MDVVIGIDSSTTSTKAVAFDSTGRQIAVGRAAIDRSTLHGTWHEQDAEQWWSSTVTALQIVGEKLSATGHRPRGIGITHQRESFVCLDEEFSPVRPAILWLDARAGRQVRTHGDARTHAISGKPPSMTPSFYKFAWLAENEPHTLAATRYVADVHGYLSYRLTGRFATSVASADPTGLIDMASGKWSDELIERVGLSRQMLAELVDPGALLGSLTGSAAAATSLPEGLPVVAGAGDGQSGGLGAGIVRPGTAYLSLGTSITMGVHAVDLPAPSRAYRVLSSPLPDGFTLEGYVASGALAVSWYRKNFVEPAGESVASTEAAVAKVEPGAGGLRFLPHLSGAGTPHYDDNARAAFIGINESHDSIAFLRAVFEGLAFEVGTILDGLEVASGCVDNIIVMGGGSASPTWLQIIADALGRPLSLSATSEGTALGAAILAAAATDLVPGDVKAAALAMTGVGERIEPDPQRVAQYALLTDEFRRIYPTLSPLSQGNDSVTTGS